MQLGRGGHSLHSSLQFPGERLLHTGGESIKYVISMEDILLLTFFN